MATTISNLNGVFKAIYANKISNLLPDILPTTVEGWLKYKISDEHAAKYPEAKEARELQNSPLMKALEEGERPSPGITLLSLIRK